METAPVKPALALRRLFLGRLERCARLASAADKSAASPWQALARRATLSTYRDCVALGAEAEARDILGRTLGQRSAA
ncbi:MAG TPA: hypothetical protein VGL23_20975 [Chloroflexota bacterium]